MYVDFECLNNANADENSADNFQHCSIRSDLYQFNSSGEISYCDFEEVPVEWFVVMMLAMTSKIKRYEFKKTSLPLRYTVTTAHSIT